MMDTNAPEKKKKNTGRGVISGKERNCKDRMRTLVGAPEYTAKSVLHSQSVQWHGVLEGERTE